MSRGPSIFVCIDGIDHVGKSTCCEWLSSTMDIPVVCSGRDLTGRPWSQEIRANNDSLVMTTLSQMSEYLPSVLFDRSAASVMVYEDRSPATFDWELYYPKDKTVFVTLVDDVENTIRREGLDFYRPLMMKRITEQSRFIKMAQFLGMRGYRTTIISTDGGPIETYKKVGSYIRAMQLDILEQWRREGAVEDD